MNVLLPEPETPVIQVRVRSGILRVMFFRLCSCAPLNVRTFPLPSLLTDGSDIYFSPRRYWAVRLSDFKNLSLLSEKTTSPQFSPPPGPISTMKYPDSILV